MRLGLAAGAVAVSDVLETKATPAAATPSMVSVAPLWKYLPVTVTATPPVVGTRAGLTALTWGPGTVHAPAAQTPLRQSPPTTQSLPASQPVQEPPPQSTSVSA